MAFPELYLVRHGQAEGTAPGGDAARALTPAGRDDVARVGGALARWIARPDVVWHSPYVRARQTADILAGALRPKHVEERDELEPDADPVVAARALVGTSRRCIVAVSHLPLLPALLEELMGGGRYEIAPATVAHVAIVGGTQARASCVLLGLWASSRLEPPPPIAS